MPPGGDFLLLDEERTECHGWKLGCTIFFSCCLALLVTTPVLSCYVIVVARMLYCYCRLAVSLQPSKVLRRLDVCYFVDLGCTRHISKI